MRWIEHQPTIKREGDTSTAPPFSRRAIENPTTFQSSPGSISKENRRHQHNLQASLPSVVFICLFDSGLDLILQTAVTHHPKNTPKTIGRSSRQHNVRPAAPPDPQHHNFIILHHQRRRPLSLPHAPQTTSATTTPHHNRTNPNHPQQHQQQQRRQPDLRARLGCRRTRHVPHRRMEARHGPPPELGRPGVQARPAPAAVHGPGAGGWVFGGVKL